MDNVFLFLFGIPYIAVLWVVIYIRFKPYVTLIGSKYICVEYTKRDVNDSPVGRNSFLIDYREFKIIK